MRIRSSPFLPFYLLIVLVSIIGAAYSMRTMRFTKLYNTLPTTTQHRSFASRKKPKPEALPASLASNSILHACSARALFSPRTDVKEALLQLIHAEHKKLCIAAYRLTDHEFVEALIAAHKKHVAIEVIVDTENLDTRISKAVFELQKTGITVYVYPDTAIIKDRYSLMHNKFIVCAKNDCADGGKMVATGSFNYTKAASGRHRENVIMLTGDAIADEYLEEFEHIKTESMCMTKALAH